jgi:hypothetical protein
MAKPKGPSLKAPSKNLPGNQPWASISGFPLLGQMAKGPSLKAPRKHLPGNQPWASISGLSPKQLISSYWV